jgi:hypothetical protein
MKDGRKEWKNCEISSPANRLIASRATTSAMPWLPLLDGRILLRIPRSGRPML